MTGETVHAGRILWMVAGFVVWAAAFAALYSVLSIGCAFGWDTQMAVGSFSVQRVLLVGLFAISLGACWWVVRVSARRRELAGGSGLALRHFMETVAWLGAWAALASTAASLLPVFFLTACT